MAHPIAAIATGFVRSGIGILRMSGDGCIDLANKVFTLSSKKPMSELPDRLLSRGTLYDEQSRPIDEAMVFVSRAPHSYTGEDTVEFQCHGSPAVLRAGLSALLSVGFRQAGPGEFTKRAFLSGQMDLTQAEAVIDLIDAETADAAANAAGQVAGVLRAKLDPIYDQLMDICSHFHAVLDYPDEDIEPSVCKRMKTLCVLPPGSSTRCFPPAAAATSSKTACKPPFSARRTPESPACSTPLPALSASSSPTSPAPRATQSSRQSLWAVTFCACSIPQASAKRQTGWKSSVWRARYKRRRPASWHSSSSTARSR